MSPIGSSLEQLESPPRLSHQHWEWTTERVGWVLMGCLVVCGLLGGLGQGPLVAREAASGDHSLRASYYAIERSLAPNALLVWVEKPNIGDRSFELSFSRSFYDAATIESVVPRPTSITVREDKVIHTFSGNQFDSGGKISYRYQHEKFGPLSYDIALNGGKPVEVRQMVLP